MFKYLFIFLILNLLLSKTFALSTKEREQFEGYLNATIHSLDKMRGDNALVVDKVRVNEDRLEILNADTSPTNIALDLMIQFELGAYETVTRILDTLSNLPFHKNSGLFFSWYKTDASMEASGQNISAVDNIHLALALYIVKEGAVDKLIKKNALQLFLRMDFSMFYDEKVGLIHGNFIHQNGSWTKEKYHYGHLGSEARILYPLGFALGLFKKYRDRKNFFSEALSSLIIEQYMFIDQDKVYPILKTWDGGAFQLLLPEILIGESNYSSRLRKGVVGYSKFIVKKSIESKLQLPAGFSASNSGDGKGSFDPIPEYNGHSGSPELVSKMNGAFSKKKFRQYWDVVVTPHAIVMASMVNPAYYAPIFKEMEKIKDSNYRLYHNDFGWLDGIHVKGKFTGSVVPILLSLDQSMIALSLMKILSKDSLSPSARALKRSTDVNQNIKKFYRLLNYKLDSLK